MLLRASLAAGLCLVASATLAEELDLNKLRQGLLDLSVSRGNEQGIIGRAATITFFGTSDGAGKTKNVYFAVGNRAPLNGWYLANCSELNEGGWFCSVSAIEAPALLFK